MMSSVSKIEFIASFVSALRENNAAVFAGAGLSVPAGFVNWKELMKTVADDLGLDIDKETDLIALAQYHINERLGNRGVINQLLINEFTKSSKITTNHKILASLPISTYWTTNYDKLIEKSIEQASKTPDVKILTENIIITKPHRDAVIYKMHGDADFPSDAVLTKEDYETYDLNRSPFSIVLQGDLFSKTFLFIGFSFEDPNLIYILSRIKNLIGTKNIRPHYAFFKKETKKELVRRQELKLKDLHRYGINGILINSYEEITDTLKEIQQLYKRSQIFISGAAEEFAEFDTENKSKEFIHYLSKHIVANNFKIISGFGFNVGSGVINGALDYIFSTNYQNIDNYLKLMPFPQFDSGSLNNLPANEVSLKKRERNAKYRDLMLSNAGVAIFIFGNKKSKDLKKKISIVSSRGMEEEFSIAVSKGIKPIPIGATGYTARKLAIEVLKNFDNYYEPKFKHLKKRFESLNKKTVTHEEIISNVIEIIKELNKY